MKPEKQDGATNIPKSAQGLRDALFLELEELRSGEGNPSKSMAVAKIAQQIISITKVEVDFHEKVLRHAETGKLLSLGGMKLGAEK